MPKELLLSGRMTQATDIYSFGLMSESHALPGLLHEACLFHMVLSTQMGMRTYYCLE